MTQNSSSCSSQFVQLESNCLQGACNVAIRACVCNSGWTNVGDFSFNTNGTCDIFVPAILGLWVAQIIVVLISCAYAVFVLYRRHQNGIMFDRRTWRVGVVPFCQIAAGLVSLPFIILKYIDDEMNAVGRNVALTILTSLFISFISFALLCGLMVLMKTSMNLLPSQSEQRFHLKKNYKSLTRLITAIAVAGSILIWSPIMVLFDKSLTLLAAQLLGIGLGGMMFLIGTFLGSFYISRLISGIDDTLRIGKEMQRTNVTGLAQMEKILFKLRVARVFQIGGFTVATIILLCFCFMPILVKKASYLIPAAFIAGQLAVDILLWSFHNSPPGTRKSRDSSANNKHAEVTDPQERRKTGWRRLSLQTMEY